MIQVSLKWETQRLQGTLPSKIVNTCNFYDDNLYLVIDNLKSNDLYTLNLVDFKWRKLMLNIPFKARFGGQYILNHGKLYCYGGSVDVEGTILLDEMLEIDLLSLKFRFIKNAPQGRVEHAMCAYRGHLFLLGGRTQKKIFNDCKTYHIGQDKWNALDCDPSYRFGHQATVYEDTIIITGGSDGSTILEDVWLLVDLKTWIKLEIKNPCALFRHQATLALKEHIIIFGGCSLDGSRYNDNFLALNLVLQKWIELPKVSRHPYPRIQHTMLALLHQQREDILIIGGMNFQDLCILNFTQMANFVELQPQSSVLSYRSHTIDRDDFLNDIPMEVQLSSDEGTSFLELGTYYEWKQQITQGVQFTPRTGHSVVQCMDQLVLFCGCDETTIVNDMYCYHINKKIWEHQPKKGYAPSPRSGCKGIVYGNEIYYFGGYTNRQGQYFNDLYQFDFKNKYWNLIKANKDIQPRVDMTLVINNGRLYIFGGADSSSRYNDLHQFEISTSQWTRLQTHGQLPSPRFGHTAEVYRNQMYVFGGWDGFKTLDELYTYSFASNYWYLEKVRNKPPSRYRHSSTLIGSSIFIFGGVDANMIRYNDLQEYNCETREWKFIETAGNTPSARTFHQLCSYETNIYLIGGNDGIKKNNDMYVIQVFDNRFSDLTSVSRLELQSSIGRQDNGLICILKTQVQELEQRLREEQEFNLCQICQIQDINAVFLECGHRFCCYDCSNKLQLCKICLKQPQRIIKIYVV